MYLVLKRQATVHHALISKRSRRVLNTFRHDYNSVRPHEALTGALPSDLYRPSPRPYPRRLEPLLYPNHFEVRRVSRNGGIHGFDN
jgi:hypothetical protein